LRLVIKIAKYENKKYLGKIKSGRNERIKEEIMNNNKKKQLG
jgi:hypothetical protein